MHRYRRSILTSAAGLWIFRAVEEYRQVGLHLEWTTGVSCSCGSFEAHTVTSKDFIKIERTIVVQVVSAL